MKELGEAILLAAGTMEYWRTPAIVALFGIVYACGEFIFATYGPQS